MDKKPLLEPRDSFLTRPLEYVAFWQFLGFILLILFVWALHLLDVSAIFGSRTEESKRWYDAWMVTVGILIVAIIVIAHTYLMERRILKGYIVVCSYCHKVNLGQEAWQQMEAFISDRTLAEFTHGVCPHCYDQVMKELEKTPRPPTVTT